MTNIQRNTGLVAHMPTFYGSYPDADARLAAARDLAAGLPGPSGLFGRDTMAGHWGDTNQQYQELATYIDDLKFGADAVHGQAALVFQEGTPQAALAETGVVASPIVVTCGYVMSELVGSDKTRHRVALIQHAYGR